MQIIDQYKGLRRELYVLFIGRMMTNMGSMIWPMFTLILNRKLGLSAGDIAEYMLLYSIAAFPISLIGGKLADKYNKRNIIVICDTVSIASYIYCALVPLTIGSIVVFALASLFQSVEWPSYDALVADFTTSKDRDRAFSLSYLGANLGLVLSPTIGGLLFNEHLNLAFLINGIAIALSTILIFFLIRDVHREEDDSVESVYEAAIASDASTFRYLRTNRVVVLFIAISALAETVYMMWDYLMPMDMASAHGEAGAALYGTITSVNCIEVVLATALITKLLTNVKGPHKMIIGQSLILSGYVIFMFLFRSVAFCYVAIVVFTAGEIVNTIASSPFLSRRIPASHRGRIISVMSIVCGGVGAILRMVIGKVYDVKGTFTAWLFVLGLGALILSGLALMSRWDRKDYRELYR